MPAGTSLGSGIALQSGNRNDYWMRKLADDWAARRAAAAKSEQEKKKAAADNQKWFLGQLTVPEGMAPMMMREAYAQIEKAYADAEQGFESGDLTSLHKIITNAKKNVSLIKTANDNAVGFFENPESEYPPGQKTTFWSENGVISDMKKYNNFLGKFPVFGEDYSVAVLPQAPREFKMNIIEHDTVDYPMIDKAGNVIKPTARLGGTTTNLYQEVSFVSDKRKKEVYTELMNNPDWVQSSLTKIIASKPDDEIAKYDLDRSVNETGEQFLARNPDIKQQLEAMTNEFVEKHVKPPQIRPFTGTPPAPKESTKKESNVVLVKHDTPQVVPGKRINIFDKDKGIIQASKPFKYDEEIDVSKAGTTYIAVTEEMKTLNPELEGLSAISMTPGTAYRNQEDGKWYVTGKVENYFTDDNELLLPSERNIKMSTMQPFIPYNNLVGKIKGTYPDIEEYMYGTQPGNAPAKGAPAGGTTR